MSGAWANNRTKVNAYVILEILADLGVVQYRIDSNGAELAGRSEAGALKEER